jgi:membrane fusion protein (multidrug efflux system)
MKKSKRLLIGFILLWIIGFIVVWGITIFKKTPIKKLGLPAILTKEKKEAKEGEMPGAVPGVQPEEEAVSVRGYKVGLTDFKDDLPVVGTVKGALEIELKFEINGVIEAINFREGDMIYKGDLVATLDKKDAQLKVDYSKSKLETAKTQLLAVQKKLEIHKKLYEIGGIIKAKLEEVELEVKSAESQLKSAEVELKSAEAELEKTQLHVPRDGVLGSRDAEAGEFVTPNNKIATLYDTIEVFVELGIVEKDIDKIALGQDVLVTVDAHPGASFTGTVDNVFPVIEGKSRTLTVRVRIENKDALLLPGMFARALITVAEFEDAIVVPSMSLNKTDEGYKVFSVDESNAVHSKIVQVAYVTTDYTVIGSGLYEGEVVVTDTPQELKDGMRVNIIEVQEGYGAAKGESAK